MVQQFPAVGRRSHEGYCKSAALGSFSRGAVALKFDEAMVAPKQAKPDDRKAEVDELQMAARHLARNKTILASPRHNRGEAESAEAIVLAATACF